MPKKLIFYTHALTGGGAERVMALLARSFAMLGHEVIFATDWDAPENTKLLGTDVHQVLLGRAHLTSICALTMLIHKERPDAVISGLAVSNFKAFCAAVLAGATAKTIQCLHGFYDVEPGLLSRLGFWSLPLTSRILGATVAVSDLLRDDLVQRFHTDPVRTWRIHNPIVIDPNAVLPTLAQLRARPPVVLAVGRLEKVKNFDLLLQAFARLQHPEAKLVILGEGSQRAALTQLALELGLGERVALPGFITNPNVWYDKAACLVVSSKSESFGLTLVEAMARGLPVVSTDCLGPREVLEDGAFGTLVPFGEPDLLAAAIDEALANPGDPAPRLAHARRFALDTILQDYDALIDSVSMPQEA